MERDSYKSSPCPDEHEIVMTRERAVYIDTDSLNTATALEKGRQKKKKDKLVAGSWKVIV
jgi:hypothetical protein